ncbi:MAG: hypothetical protein ABI193_12425, partial [Minicystis sp.]
MISLDQALDHLLHRRSYREAFLADRHALLDLAPDDLAALATLDRAQLVLAAEGVREDLLQRSHRGSGGLRALYPRTIAAWTQAHPEDETLHELLFGFMESEPFARYHELPFAGQGLCLEEAFHRFAESASIGDPTAREEEFLTAMVKALLLSPRPDFSVPAEIRRTPGGFFALGTRGDPALYAAVQGRLVLGPLTPFLAALLEAPEEAATTAARHG